MSASKPHRKKRPANRPLRPAPAGLVDPGDWVMQGSAWPGAHRAYGFKERQAAQAAVSAYMETFMAAEDQAVPVDRPALVAAMVARFESEVAMLAS